MSKIKEVNESSEERKARLEAKLDRLKHKNGKAFEGFEDDEVTDVIDLAMQRLEKVSESVTATVQKAASDVVAVCKTPRRA